METKKTPNLPKTNFSMRAGLPTLEKKIIDSTEMWISTNGKETDVILHDGPPYANGNIHIGHAYNKVLKDFLFRYLTLKNKQQPNYVCGWDCHGLPIELAANKEEGVSATKDLKHYREYAVKQVQNQKHQFRNLGINIQHKYETMDSSFEDEELKCFQQLVKSGFIETGVKPVNWCWSCQTSLAETELNSNSKKDTSIYVLFPSVKEKQLSFLAWTTTPWTLKANRALAINTNIQYVIVELPTGQIVVTSEWFAKNHLGKESHQYQRIDISLILNTTYKSLFSETEYPIFHADYVGETVGTGIVHIAPSCGKEDYVFYTQTFPADKSAVFSHADSKGCIDGVFYQKENEQIIESLAKTNFLWKQEEVEHNCSFCWRCKNPTIQRATPQTFLRFESKKDLLVSEAKKIQFHPKKLQNRFFSFLLSRTEWCLSRQRKWGVPIPLFSCSKCLKEHFDLNVKTVEQWRSETYKPECPSCLSNEYTVKGTDILDVWFDSGLTYRTLHKKKADWIIEGSDQHRGWFQSLHILSCLLEGQTCLEHVVSHGFVLDEKGKKMSKSEGNVIDPLLFASENGIEILRLWAASQQVGDDISIGETAVKSQSETYRRIRNTLRFLHGNLYDFNAEVHKSIAPNQDEQNKIQALEAIFHNAFENMNPNKFISELLKYLDKLSSGYIEASKKVLYDSEPNSAERRKIQATFKMLLTSLMEMIEIILPFTICELKSFVESEKYSAIDADSLSG
jgi:isoleucyl-tRNA synthetase